MIDFLLVTCCRDQSRFELLKQVINNLKTEAPQVCDNIIVFDNDSTIEGTIELLTSNFKNVVQSSKNVGYWTAIDYWLKNCVKNEFAYIIESDMIHYDFYKLNYCVKFLLENESIGSVRLHEYSVENYHLFNKDKPLPNSKKNLWQSHTNKITQQKIRFIDKTMFESIVNIWSTTFLTQLPALNRTYALQKVFEKLSILESFTEIDFQKLYWDLYQLTGILDGGIFHCDLNPYNSKVITGSWTDSNTMKKIGYFPTRVTKILNKNEYNVKIVC